MSGQTFAAGSRVTGTQLTNIVYQNAVNISNAAVTESSSSASYVSLGAVSSFSFTKALTSTNVKVFLSFGWSASVATTIMKAGVLINGTDTDVMQQILGVGASGVIAGEVVVTGLSAGTYTVQARWKRVSASGTFGRNATNDWMTMTASEVT